MKPDLLLYSFIFWFCGHSIWVSCQPVVDCFSQFTTPLAIFTMGGTQRHGGVIIQEMLKIEVRLNNYSIIQERFPTIPAAVFS
jgi:hypothetical protein